MSSIGSIGSTSSMAHSMRGMKRPDPAEMAANLFSKLDTSGQGYISKSDLQSAVDKVSASTSATSSSSSIDDLFSTLDSDSDGKVTQQEFSESLQQ